MLELDSMEMIVYITIKATVPRLVVLDGRGCICRCKGIKREFKILFSCKLFSGNSFDIQSFFGKLSLSTFFSLSTQMYFCCGENLATTRNMSVFTGYHFLECNE